MNFRSRTLLIIIVGAIVLAAGLLGYSYFIEPNRLVVTRETIAIRNWDPAYDGFRVAMISDIHGGSNGAAAENIQRVVQTVNAEDADVVVLLGDFVSPPRMTSREAAPLPMSAREVADNLAGLKAKHGVFAVLGNNDGLHADEEVATELRRVGYRVLQNEIAILNENGVPLRLLGLRDHLQLDSWAKFDLTVRSVVNAYPKEGNIVVLEHSPDILYVMNYWKHLNPDLKLMLAGHTHGGQVWLPIVGPPIVPSSVGQKYAHGHVVEEGVHMFVTSGVGTSILPFRFLVPPEVALLTIRREL